MWSSRFEPEGGEIWIPVRVSGPLGRKWLQFLLDTGTAVSVIDTSVMDALGYNASAGKRTVRMGSIGGVQDGYALDVERLGTMGFERAPCELICQDLPRGVDGLIGLDLLRGRILTVDAITGTITVAP